MSCGEFVFRCFCQVNFPSQKRRDCINIKTIHWLYISFLIITIVALIGAIFTGILLNITNRTLETDWICTITANGTFIDGYTFNYPVTCQYDTIISTNIWINNNWMIPSGTTQLLHPCLNFDIKLLTSISYFILEKNQCSPYFNFLVIFITMITLTLLSFGFSLWMLINKCMMVNRGYNERTII